MDEYEREESSTGSDPELPPYTLAGEALSVSETADDGMDRVKFMVPTGGPDDWRRLLADPDLHWVVGRSARTLAHSWESAVGWPTEIGDALRQTPSLAAFRPVYGFPEFKTPLPGGRRASQTDLLVLATDGRKGATVAIEGKVDEPFGPTVVDWLGADPSPGKVQRLAYLAEVLDLSPDDLSAIRYQLVHRAAAAKIEAGNNGSAVAAMLVHSWAPRLEGFSDFRAFGALLRIEAEPGRIDYSESADLWLGWIKGDPRHLTS